MKRFLGIGINEYQGNALNGCVPDIKLLSKIASEVYKYDSINTLLDVEATKANIIQSIRKAGEGLTEKDWLWVAYSGHGSYQPCSPETVKTEPDGYDEGLVPYDYDELGLLIDDQLNKIIVGLHSQLNLVVSCDSCFSGSVLRLNPARDYKNRFMPPSIKNLEMHPEISRKAVGGKRLVPFIVNTLEKQRNAILISGCGEHQTSADVYITSMHSYHGAMTYNLVEVLKEHDWNISYRELIVKLNEKLRTDEYEQISQLECKEELMDKLFLGGPV